MSVNVTPLLLCPLTVTTTGPVAAPAGTLVAMDVALHAVTAAATPLNMTMLVPCVCPKSVPAMVTACAQESDIVRGREVGVDAYVTKPFDPATLVRTVRDLVDRPAS